MNTGPMNNSASRHTLLYNRSYLWHLFTLTDSLCVFLLSVVFSDYVVMDDNELKDEMKLPVFGNGEVLCKNVASGGLYRCGKVPATA